MTEPYTPSVKGAREDLRDWLRRYRTARNRKRDLDNRLKNVLADLTKEFEKFKLIRKEL